MITKESIQDQITKLTLEKAALQTQHEAFVASFQQQQQHFNTVVQGNQNRFQQITGALQNLTELLKTLEPPPEAPPA